MQPVYYPIEDYAQDVLKEARERAARERITNGLSKRADSTQRRNPVTWLASLWRKLIQQRPIPQH